MFGFGGTTTITRPSYSGSTTRFASYRNWEPVEDVRLSPLIKRLTSQRLVGPSITVIKEIFDVFFDLFSSVVFLLSGRIFRQQAATLKSRSLSGIS